MRNSRHNFTESMDRAKELAQVRRNRGLATGKSAKGWARKRPHHTPAKGSWDRLLTETRVRWNHAAGTAVDDYLWAVNPSRDDIETWLKQGGSLI